MCNSKSCDYTIHGAQHHFGWDNSFEPVQRVEPGSTIFFECQDSSAGQITPESDVKTIETLDFGKINPVNGPVYIEGAGPGDVIKVSIRKFEPSGFGWTANIPGFGLLADDFTEAAIQIWDYDKNSMSPAAFGDIGKIPLKPFAGTIGLAPAESGLHSIVPPRRMGGNMDIRDLTEGTELYLPVEVKGALFSIGDTHAAQGDGEVCGTAIESPMNVIVSLDLIKNEPLKMPRFTTYSPVTNHLDIKGYEVTTGIGSDLMAGAKAAVSQMIDFLCKTQNMSAVEAYMMCSVCGDLRISEIVDQPNWLVSFYFPRVVFD